MSKLHSRGVLVVGAQGSVKPLLLKESAYRIIAPSADPFTSGLLKYLDLPEGTRICVTITVLEDGEE